MEDKGLSTNEGISLELSSHVGLAIVAQQGMSGYCFQGNAIAIGPKEDAIMALINGNTIYRASDGAIMASVSQHFQKGDSVSLVPEDIMKEKLRFEMLRSDFKVTDEGAISPVGKPDLALGISDPSLILVSRDSPSQLIL